MKPGLGVIVAGVALLAGQAQFRSSTDLVEVYVTAKSRDGTIARDLTRSDFELFEDGKRREIAVFSQSIQPLSVSLVLDHSSSARSEFPSIRLAAQEFVGRLLPPDRVSISTLTWDCPPFAHDSPTLMSLLRTNLPSDMGSPIWSATDRAMSSLESESGRRVILLLSDGDDNGNSMPAGQAQIHPFDRLAGRIHNPCEPALIDPKQSIGKVINRAERDAVMVYAVVVQPSDASSTSGPADLARLALRSGAEVRQLGSYAELRSAFARIADELHLQYLLGFVPAAFDGKRHEIEVKSTQPGVRVRARQAYIATRSEK